MLTLRWKADTTVPVEADVLRPDRLRGLTAAQVAALEVFHGNTRVPLGEFFTVSGSAEDGRVLLEGDLRRVKWIGAGMTDGELIVEGDAGMHLGAEMHGGRIDVRGNVADWCGAEMRGGIIRVHGNAGHLLGAAYRGSARGMRGGTIIVHGSAGNEVGSTMRRGLIVVEGAVGDFCGVSMIAGTIVVRGAVGLRPAAGMKRGTLWLVPPEPGGSRPRLVPTCRYACMYRPVFLRLFWRHLLWIGVSLPETTCGRLYERYCGDLVEGGLGEILLWSRP